jgi:hypothetical protein
VPVVVEERRERRSISRRAAPVRLSLSQTFPLGRGCLLDRPHVFVKVSVTTSLRPLPSVEASCRQRTENGGTVAGEAPAEKTCRQSCFPFPLSTPPYLSARLLSVLSGASLKALANVLAANIRIRKTTSAPVAPMLFRSSELPGAPVRG